MKKLMLVALSMVISSMVFAQSGRFSNDTYGSNPMGWQQMNDVHNIMHNSSITQQLKDQGISVQIVANEEASIESIKKRFIDDKAKLEAYFGEVSIAVSSLDNGVQVILESSDPQKVKDLQRYGNRELVRFLHGDFAGMHRGRGYHHGGSGAGMMHGGGFWSGNGERKWDGHMGYRNGMMNNNGYRNGMMNNRSWSDQDSQTWDDHMGYGPGMM